MFISCLSFYNWSNSSETLGVTTTVGCIGMGKNDDDVRGAEANRDKINTFFILEFIISFFLFS
jgi:hypothetical protein